MTSGDPRREAVARALWQDNANHAGIPVQFNDLSDGMRARWYRKADAALAAADAARPVPADVAGLVDEPVAWLYEPYLGPSLTGDHHDGMWGAPRLSFDQPYSTDRNITPLYARSVRPVPPDVAGLVERLRIVGEALVGSQACQIVADAMHALVALAAERDGWKELAEGYQANIEDAEAEAIDFRARTDAAIARAEKAEALLRDARYAISKAVAGYAGGGIDGTLARIDALLAAAPQEDRT